MTTQPRDAPRNNVESANGQYDTSKAIEDSVMLVSRADARNERISEAYILSPGFIEIDSERQHLSRQRLKRRWTLKHMLHALIYSISSAFENFKWPRVLS